MRSSLRERSEIRDEKVMEESARRSVLVDRAGPLLDWRDGGRHMSVWEWEWEWDTP